jgi:asparaginyl-tRNA synthetase
MTSRAATAVRVRHLAEHVGETVTICGWLVHRRGHGALTFLVVRDGSGVVQAVVREDRAPAAFERAQALGQESAVCIVGSVAAQARAPGGYELQVEDLTVVSAAEDYPISPKEHGIEFLMDHRHLWLRHSRPAAVMRIRDTVQWACEAFLRGEGFVRVDAPILMGTAAENTTQLFRTDYFGQPAYLTQSGQLYAEAAAMALGRVYTLGPTFRAERSKTRRHLLEFWMLEPEMAFCTLDESMALQERLIEFVVGACLERTREELKVLERDTAPLERVRAPFPRLRYDDAAERVRALGLELGPDEDFGAPHETAISQAFDRPVFIHAFPASIKPFYMEPEAGDGGRVLAADLLAPEGYGEIIGGSQRIADPALLARRLAEAGLDAASYDWYMDLRRYGGVVHSGFGLGIERTVAWIAGLGHVREAIPFPRTYNRLTP